ncbi:MAG TPA: pepsin/retropepsin-like aspartic protease family protein [Kofleriaceae bacterium]|nr:pepsin/retropepsin-like aspartic protease family protein [Kofleriaceae bacterium]
MHIKACLFAAVLSAGCTPGAPSGFSKGDRWTFPLVGPLEDGLLLTPVTVKGKGPYLFAIDPDANITAIDKQVVDEAGLRQSGGPVRVDEAASEQMRGYAELTDLQIGGLTIDRRQVMMVPSDFYNAEGRRVNGVIGRDVLANALVFGVDRDQGIATLTAVKTFAPPPDAIAVVYESLAVDVASMPAATGQGGRMESSNVDDASRAGVVTRGGGPALDVAPLSRRVAAAEIGGVKLTMHLDLGSPVSQLREALWSKAKLTPSQVRIRLVDEVATVREVTEGAIASEVALGAAKASHVTLVPYVDKRFAIGKIDGSLGLDFFQPYAVYANWDARTFYLKPRGDAAATLAARTGRWGAALPACPHPGCVTATLSTTEAGVKLEIVRDPEAARRALEVRVGVKPAAGKTAAPLVVELPSSVDKISGGVPANYDGATLTVLDVSPFTRPCSEPTGCVYQFTTAHETTP